MEFSTKQNERPTFPAEPLLEVWLIDTGQFLVLDDLLPEFRSDFRWMKTMRLRRKLRLYLPRSEVQHLPGIERAFSIAKRGPEIRDSLKAFHEWFSESDRLERARVSLEEGGATTEQILEAQDVISEHWKKKVAAFGNVLRAISGLSLMFPGATDVAIKLAPFRAVRVPWPKEKEVGKKPVETRKR